MKKKFFKLSIILIILIIISQITYSIDKRRISETKDPLFAFRTNMMKDGGSSKYIGIGYIIFKWNKRAENGYMIGYEMYRLPTTKKFEDGPSIDLKLIKY